MASRPSRSFGLPTEDHRRTSAPTRDRMSVTILGGALAVAVLSALTAGVIAMNGRPAAAAASPEAPVALFGSELKTRTTDTAAPQVGVPLAQSAVTQATDAAPVEPQVARANGAAAPRAAPAGAAQAVAAAGTPELKVEASPAQAQAAPTQAAAIATTEPARGSSALSGSVPVLEREHKVLTGETLLLIAQRYGLTTETLVVNNAGVTDRDLLKIGQTLRIPPRDGLLYELRLGDSVQAIANRYGVEASAIVAEPANRLTSPDTVREGQVVLVPGAKVARPAPTVVPAAAAATATTSPATTTARGASAPAVATTLATTVATPAARPPQNGGGWMWPITGPLSSYFGPSHPLGIDIDLYARDGAPIRAARAGVVTFAGGNPCCSYGYYVEVDHGDGYTTIYAHFNAPPPVRIGQRVEQGQVVGSAGTTGYSTGTHLHFEVRKNGVPQSPLTFLP